MLYRYVLRPLLYRLDAETAHRVIAGMLRLAQKIPGLLGLISLLLGRPRMAPVRALGLEFPSPVGLAAGFDKNAEMYEALGAVGFGHVEVGTITGEGQSGNPKPRLFRLPRDRALVNRMGFNNHGAEHAAQELARAKKRNVVLGINIGKTKIVPAEQAASDYEKSAELLGPHADYMVVNVSSPNTPGLRDLQAVDSLRPILQTVRRALDRSVTNRRVPLLVKIAPDLNEEDILAVADLALELELDGIIATNTTISREGLSSPVNLVEACGAGGLSGAPLKERALHVLRILRKRVGSRLVLIAAGGVENAEDAWLRIRAGASLVQIYSALIDQGACLPSAIARGLHKRQVASGKEWNELIGIDASPSAR